MGGFAEVYESFAEIILYNFDTSNEVLTVTNNYLGPSVINGLPTGNYPFSLTGTNDISINSLNGKYT